MSCLGFQGVELQLCRAAEAAEQAAAAATALREQRDALDVVTVIADALATLILPALLVIIIWKFWPVLRGIFETRKFTIKLAGFELSAQEATDQIRKQIEDLQAQVAHLKSKSEQPDTIAKFDMDATKGVIPETPLDISPTARRILWVDDQPENNAFLIAAFRDDGVEVITALSTSEAMERLTRPDQRFGLIISDQGRVEDGKYRTEAGTQLLKEIRAAGYDLPVAIFTTARGVRMGGEARKAGAEVMTGSTDLRRFVERHLGENHAD